VRVTNGTFTLGGFNPTGPSSTTIGWTFLACAGFTVTVALPDLLVSWVEVAVIVTGSEVTPPGGAVNKPELEIVPALADQVTLELKLPVPITVAEH
jgi:hypothetical protein